MADEAKQWWEVHGKEYQATSSIPIDVLYGPGSPNEESLRLIGSVAGKRVLELGCGGAQASIAFAKQGAIVTALDIASSELEFARRLTAEHGVSIQFHQGDMADLSMIPSGSQDVVFSACAVGYVDDLSSCFKEVHRVLRSEGLFLLSAGHPFGHSIDEKSLRLHGSYFETGKSVMGAETGCAFASVHRTVSDYFNLLVDSGFAVERIVEPDSRTRYPCDPWFGLWENTPERLRLFPATIIFKSRRTKQDGES